jgi:hypothetical protein
LYDLVNWRLQNLQMNCFLGRDADADVALALEPPLPPVRPVPATIFVTTVADLESCIPGP